jgi:autotransporter passenger strand-loop-strand repeat protein
MNNLKYLFVIFVFCSGNSYAACNIVGGQAYGDCAGVNINKEPAQFLEVSSYKSESGIIKGAKIYNGGRLYLSGISNSDIIVAKGGMLTVTGQVNGAIINNGGIVEIEGYVSSLIANAGKVIIGGFVSYVSGSAEVIYKSGAVIGGIPVK